MPRYKPRIKVILIAQDYEMKIASDILLLTYYMEKELGIEPWIVVFDNGSTDRTTSIAKKLGIKVLRSNQRRIKKDIVEEVMETGIRNNINTLIILDVQGGNTADDAISLMARSIAEGQRFASAYIRPEKNMTGIGCWAIDKGILIKIGKGEEMDIQKRILELASKQDLELWAISEEVSLQSKKNRRKLIRLFKRSPLEVLSGLVRYHPLSVYGFIGLLLLSLAILSGFYTVDYFYRNNELNYFPAFTTMALTMIGGFFMMAGLFLNTLNVLVERLEAMAKWNE
jgi:glycosyltransferase involved in cell wall biosynthesis